MKKFKLYKKEKHNRLATVFTDFTRDKEADGFIVSNMKVQFECVPDRKNPEDIAMILTFHCAMNVTGASTCEKLSEDSEVLPFPPPIPKDMAMYCATAMLDHFAKVFTIVNQDCKRQFDDMDKHPENSHQADANFIKGEYSTHIVLKESDT
mgnify:CR=1 FL=1